VKRLGYEGNLSIDGRIIIKGLKRALGETADYIHLDQENVHDGILWRR
jgi:hypothetical protein